MIGLLTAALHDAAVFERDQRHASYSRRAQEGRLAGVEHATLDYQCWVAIAEWLETDRFREFAGGTEPGNADAPIVSWPRLEEAAHDALQRVAAKADAKARDAGKVGLDGPATQELHALQVRHARLRAIHAKVQLRRQMVDSINAEFRAMREQPKAVAA